MEENKRIREQEKEGVWTWWTVSGVRVTLFDRISADTTRTSEIAITGRNLSRLGQRGGDWLERRMRSRLPDLVSSTSSQAVMEVSMTDIDEQLKLYLD
jgi:hypothetical protein